MRDAGGLSHISFKDVLKRTILRTPATISMYYAHMDSKCAVCMGYYFDHMTPDDFALPLRRSVFDAIIKDFFNTGGI